MPETVNLARRGFLRGKLQTPTAQLRLPWVTQEQDFIEQCTRCNDCLTACPENILVKGDGGFPTVDFTKGECTFCQACVDVCTQPFFVDDKSVKAWPIHLTFLDNCLAKNSVLCQSCQDVCDTEAISFSYSAGSIPQPQISQSDCTGCGACVMPCPSQAIALNLIESTTVATEEKQG